MVKAGFREFSVALNPAGKMVVSDGVSAIERDAKGEGIEFLAKIEANASTFTGPREVSAKLEQMAISAGFTGLEQIDGAKAWEQLKGQASSVYDPDFTIL